MLMYKWNNDGAMVEQWQCKCGMVALSHSKTPSMAKVTEKVAKMAKAKRSNEDFYFFLFYTDFKNNCFGKDNGTRKR
ncbi:hypothetical protein VNO78_06398 [Psophocarpus tetragonolobus]|uniref:Uncharacterized protein n=1 Tax=Psophocarpus tetragonolobus TaxID=3891 RepID=A0AAN9SS37_PSOTE